MSNTDPTQNCGWTQVLVKGKQFRLLILAILFSPFGLLAPKTYKIIWLSTESVHDEGYLECTWWRLFQKRVVRMHLIWYLRFYLVLFYYLRQRSCYSVIYSQRSCYSVIYSRQRSCYSVIYSQRSCYSVIYSRQRSCYSVIYSRQRSCYSVIYSRQRSCYSVI
jgi:hypothetical protein